MAESNVTAGAWIIGGRVRHDINRDHFGDLSTLNVITDAPIGQMEQGTPLHYVLDWLVERMIKLESSNHFGSGFQADAYILAPGGTVDLGDGTIMGVFGAHAAFSKKAYGSLTVDALFALSFSLDAVIKALEELTVDAVIV